MSLDSAGQEAIAVATESGGDPLGRHDRGLIGAPIARLDGPLKVRGQARFAAEFPMEGMVYAALAYSTVPRGRVATLDTSAAEAAPGVLLVMTHRNAPRMNAAPAFGTAPLAASANSVPVCRTTWSTGTASRSRWCSPRRRSRPTMPGR